MKILQKITLGCYFLLSFLCTISAQKQQNMLFIAVDDLKPILSNYGNEQIITPNFDRLAAMGVTFTNAHTQQAVCGPSRASIMTGVSPDQTRVWDLHTNFRKSNPSIQTMPEYLIGLGYETTAVGKIFHKSSTSKGHDGASWSIPHILPDDYDTKYGAPAYGTYHNPETIAKIKDVEKELKAQGKKNNRTKVFKKVRPATEMADVSDEAYQDGVYTKEAIKRMKSMAAGDKPFFLAVGYQKPHLPFVAPKKYWDLYKREDIQLEPLQTKGESIPSIAYHNFGELRAYSDIPSNLDVGTLIDEDKQRELIHGYMACISYIDAQLGKLLDTYEALGLQNNTQIVLWSDHGYHLGDHTIWCKHSNFEQATRVPLMFVGPGVEKGIQVDNPVELLDVFPTLFELANVKPSAQAEGISLVPLLDGNKSTTVSKNYAFSQFPRRKDVKGYSIRTDRYRYTEWHENNYNSHLPYNEENIIARELYDYQEDPLESANLVDNKDYRSISSQMKSKLKTHLVSKEDPKSLSALEPIVKESTHYSKAKKIKKGKKNKGKGNKTGAEKANKKGKNNMDNMPGSNSGNLTEKEARKLAKKKERQAIRKAERKAEKKSGIAKMETIMNAPTDHLPAKESLKKINKKSKTTQPNIVFIMADDLGYHDLSLTGSQIYQTPNIDKLANESIQFTSAYSSYPRCTPSRYALITGTYPTIENKGDLSTMKAESSFVKQFKKAGYQSAFIGKWHLGAGKSSPKNIGFDYSFAAGSAGGAGSHFYPFNTPKHSANPDKVIEDVSQVGTEGEYLADLLTDQAMAYMNNAEDGKPFILMLSQYAVHTPLEAKEADIKRNKKQIKSHDFCDVPEYITEGEGRNKMRQDDPLYAGMVENLDENVGKLMKFLEELGIADNTIVVFSSDHGGLSNDGNKRQRHLATTNLPLRAGKGHLYEGGIRVPLFIRYPKKINPEIDSESIVLGMDVMPTLLDIATDKKLKNIDGKSFEKVINTSDKWDNRTVFWHSAKARPYSTGDIPCTSVRSGNYKLLHFFEVDKYELYDLSADISEENNLISTQPEKARELKKILKDWKKQQNI